MAGLGIIATVGAFANLKRRKKELNELIEKRDGLMAAISAYNNSKYDAYIDKTTEDFDTKPTEKPEGVTATIMLRVANLFGRLMHARTSVFLTNTSDRSYYLWSVSAECKLYDEALSMYKLNGLSADPVQQKVNFNKCYELKPGEVLEIQMPKGITGISDMEKLRSDICEVAGKRLITSCPKLNIEDFEFLQCDFLIKWSDTDKQYIFDEKATNPKDALDSMKKNPDFEEKEWLSLKRKGILRYCGEAGLG